MKLDKVTAELAEGSRHFYGTVTGVKTKSQYELDEEKGFPLRNYIQEIVREEIAAHEERLVLNINAKEVGEAAIKAINEAQKKKRRTLPLRFNQVRYMINERKD